MTLTEKLANSIGKNAKLTLDIDDNREKVIVYGAINLLQTIWTLLWLSLISYILGVFYEALIFSIVVSFLRKYSGGVHASSPGRCIIIGTTVSVGFALLINKVLLKVSIPILLIAGVFIIAFSYFVVIKKVPVDSPKKPIKSYEMRKRLKLYSIMLLHIYLLVMFIALGLNVIQPSLLYTKIFECICLGTLWQSFTLTEKASIILNRVDVVLKHILERST